MEGVEKNESGGKCKEYLWIMKSAGNKEGGFKCEKWVVWESNCLVLL